MLRKIRIALAAIFFIGITLLLLGIGQGWWGWMAKLQFLPACLGLNAAVIAALVVITLLFGRIYCSVICPLGIFQDQFYALHKRLNKKHRQTFSPQKKWLRYTVLAVFIACLIAGVQIIIALLAPYSAYGRIVSSIVHPASWVTVTVAAVTAITLAILAWRGGRTYCNTFCPVGTFLSFFSRFSLFRPVIDTDKCVKCHQCERACRASCIDVDTGKIDYSRCVDCFDCIDSCSLRGLRYRLPKREGTHGVGRISEETQSLRQRGGSSDRGACRSRGNRSNPRTDCNRSCRRPHRCTKRGTPVRTDGT